MTLMFTQKQQHIQKKQQLLIFAAAADIPFILIFITKTPISKFASCLGDIKTSLVSLYIVFLHKMRSVRVKLFTSNVVFFLCSCILYIYIFVLSFNWLCCDTCLYLIIISGFYRYTETIN